MIDDRLSQNVVFSNPMDVKLSILNIRFYDKQQNYMLLYYGYI